MKEIKGIKRIIDNGSTNIVVYNLNDGNTYTAVVEKELSPSTKKTICDFYEEKSILPNKHGQQMTGFDCIMFYRNLYQQMTSIYKVNEYVTFKYFTSTSIKEKDEFYQASIFMQSMLEKMMNKLNTNSTFVSPTWQTENRIYNGESIDLMFSPRSAKTIDEYLTASIKHDLAEGRTSFSSDTLLTSMYYGNTLDRVKYLQRKR